MTLFHFKACRLCGSPHQPHYSRIESRCASCHRARMHDLRRADPEYQRRDRERAKLPHRKAHNRTTVIKWRKDHPDAYRAQTAVGNAVRDGKLKKLPCAICGTVKSVHAHHSDYSNPLNVKWLCAKCHHRVHALFPEIRGHKGAL